MVIAPWVASRYSLLHSYTPTRSLILSKSFWRISSFFAKSSPTSQLTLIYRSASLASLEITTLERSKLKGHPYHSLRSLVNHTNESPASSGLSVKTPCSSLGMFCASLVMTPPGWMP